MSLIHLLRSTILNRVFVERESRKGCINVGYEFTGEIKSKLFQNKIRSKNQTI